MSNWPLPTKVRKDPLGYPFRNSLAELERINQFTALAEHTADGKHNALEVARAVASYSWSGAAYSKDSGSSDKLTAVSKIATGVIDLTLDSAYFALPLDVRVENIDDAAESVPVMAEHEVRSATTIRVYLYVLNALGANTWNAADGDFAIAVHALPFTSSATPISTLAKVLRGYTVGPVEWNKLVANQAKLRAALLLEHTSAGAHNTRDVARGTGRCSYNAGWTLNQGYKVASVTAISSGRARITLSDGYTSPLQVFGAADYSRAAGGSEADFYIVNFPKSQYGAGPPMTIDAYQYLYSTGANTWSRHECDFAFTVHTAPA